MCRVPSPLGTTEAVRMKTALVNATLSHVNSEYALQGYSSGKTKYVFPFLLVSDLPLSAYAGCIFFFCMLTLVQNPFPVIRLVDRV